MHDLWNILQRTDSKLPRKNDNNSELIVALGFVKVPAPSLLPAQQLVLLRLRDCSGVSARNYKGGKLQGKDCCAKDLVKLMDIHSCHLRVSQSSPVIEWQSHLQARSGQHGAG